MSSVSHRQGGICVLGRTYFETGIGQHSLAALELFSRVGEVALFPTDRPELGEGDTIFLPNGRPITITRDPSKYGTSFFCDVPWNGAYDVNYTAVPKNGVRIIYAAFDSDQLPPEWVTIMNERFDVALFTTSAVEEVARNSGVFIATGVLPLALDIENLLARPFQKPVPNIIRFGSIAAFHPRKNLLNLVTAFTEAFPPGQGFELVIHSNLAMGRTFEQVRSVVDRLPPHYVTLSNFSLDSSSKEDLLASFDVFVNVSSGEGFSIGPREALALGKPLVLSDIPPHRDLGNLEGVFFVPEQMRMPAVYPEIDGREFGTQATFETDDIKTALLSALDYVSSPASSEAIQKRRSRAAEFSFTTLADDYRVLMEQAWIPRQHAQRSSFASLPTEALEARRVKEGAGTAKSRRPRIVVQAHDGGFFSLFNTYFSTLVWSLQDPAPPMVLPDWDVGRLLKRTHLTTLESYCYSSPSDGNMWLGLFEPLYDLTAEEMNDEVFLYENATIPEAKHNERKEPLLTHVHAFDLYRAPWFSAFRQQYHQVFREHIRLKPHFQEEIDTFRSSLDDRFMISVHVKHPSHAIEQPQGKIAQSDEYFAAIRDVLSSRHISAQSDDWRVFVATDQERVIDSFRQEYGERFLAFSEVTRISPEVDEKFDALSAEEQFRVGHQLQHQLASDPASWSLSNAWEVWRDAEAMAMGSVMLHGVSNVATAASYFNPTVEMIFCSPDE